MNTPGLNDRAYYLLDRSQFKARGIETCVKQPTFAAWIWMADNRPLNPTQSSSSTSVVGQTWFYEGQWLLISNNMDQWRKLIIVIDQFASETWLTFQFRDLFIESLFEILVITK